jgi:hypothetical protein
LYKRRLATALFALVALVAVVAGCGGGGSSSSTGGDSTNGGSTEADSGGSAPTKAAFIKEADKVCGDAEKELTEEVEEFAKEQNIPIGNNKEPTEAQQTELFQQVILPNIAEQGEELAALKPPEGDEGTIEELTGTLEDEVTEAEEEGGLGEEALAGATRLARAYGFKTCGS